MKTTRQGVCFKGDTKHIKRQAKPVILWRDAVRSDNLFNFLLCPGAHCICFRVSKHFNCCSVTFKQTEGLFVMSTGSSISAKLDECTELDEKKITTEMHAGAQQRKSPLTNHITVICLRSVNQTVGLH